ncbi:MAG: metal-dependent hydrolase, partial [Saprospiraceae bacterium]|nr:metal-dependent hydrolase [Saprospiraceae bacterium]
MQDLDKLRFPIGKFVRPEAYSEEQMNEWIETITMLPNELYDLMTDIPEEDDSILDQPYRPGGWSARQVIHHLADSHMNS